MFIETSLLNFDLSVDSVDIYICSYYDYTTNNQGWKLLLEENTGINQTTTEYTHLKVTYKKGLYNYNVKCYWNGIVEIYDYIFAELNKLIASKKVNFFKQGASF